MCARRLLLQAQTPPYLAAIPLGSEAMHPMAGMASAFLPQASQFTHATTPTELPPTGPNSSTPLPPTGLLPQHSGRGQGGVIPLTALLQHPIASLQQPCTLEAGPPYSQVSTCWSLGLSSLAKWYRSHVSALLLLTATCSISGGLCESQCYPAVATTCAHVTRTCSACVCRYLDQLLSCTAPGPGPATEL